MKEHGPWKQKIQKRY